MPVLFPTLTPDPFLPSATDDKHQEQDIWFDALDYVDMDETWFDASDEAFGDQSEYNKKADMLVPFTEDCQRCVKQLIGILGDVKQTELIAACLSFMPGVPVSLVITVNTIYTAVLERKILISRFYNLWDWHRVIYFQIAIIYLRWPVLFVRQYGDIQTRPL